MTKILKPRPNPCANLPQPILTKKGWQFGPALVEKEGPKIAFGSSGPRKYLPFDLGNTFHPDYLVLSRDSPNPKYFPPPLGVHKPISKLGYGIGGLLYNRFSNCQKGQGKYYSPNEITEITPGPGQYDPKPMECQPCNPKQKAVDCKTGFLTSLSEPRFNPENINKTPGPGVYNPNTNDCKKVEMFESFGGQRKIKPSIRSMCIFIPGKDEKCETCQEILLYDYYRSKSKLEYTPPPPNHDQNVKKPQILSFCRPCFCNALSHIKPQWARKSFRDQFEKVRHCSHYGGNTSWGKTNCALVNKLTKKEVIMAKYFDDQCPQC